LLFVFQKFRNSFWNALDLNPGFHSDIQTGSPPILRQDPFNNAFLSVITMEVSECSVSVNKAGKLKTCNKVR